MNIRAQLLITHSKPNTNKIVEYIGSNKDCLAELMDCFFSNEYRVTQRAAMAVSAVFDKSPKFINPYLSKMILNLENKDLHVAIKRNTIRILQFIEIPEKLISSLFDCCISYLLNKDEPIAVKAFSMGIVYNICKIYPELKVEVIPILEDIVEYSDSAGILSRGTKILKKLSQLNNF